MFATWIQRDCGPICRATRAPPADGVSESRSPVSTSTGTDAGTSGGAFATGGSATARAGHCRQASYSSMADVVHSFTVKGAKVLAGKAFRLARY